MQQRKRLAPPVPSSSCRACLGVWAWLPATLRSPRTTAAVTVVSQWIGFAVAHHLNQEHAQAVNVLDAYENAQDKNSEGDRRYELGQLAQYRLLVLREAGDASAALAYLTGNRKQFMDDRYCTEKEVELLLALGRGEEAAPLLEGLIDTNPDRTEYFRQLFRAKGLDSTAPKDAAAVLTLLDEKRAGFPKAQVPVMLALEVATGDDFRQRM